MRINQLFIGGLAGAGLAFGAGAACCTGVAGACAGSTDAKLDNRAANRKGQVFMRRIVNCAGTEGKMRAG